MTTMTNKQLIATLATLVVIVGVAVGVNLLFRGTPAGQGTRYDIAGAVGNLTAENYDPYIQQNGGYYSNLPIKTSDDLNTSGTLSVTGTATIGSSGSAVSTLNFGSCNLQPDAATITASSTARVTCHGSSWANGQAAFVALTGITSTSKIIASLSTTTAGSIYEGLVLIGVTASSTSGFIETRISNQTGATYTWPTSGNASGTMQYIGIK